jgi:transglutaminase-like putative cysteine protease
MLVGVKADLVYRFDQACEVLLQIEAARVPGQRPLAEQLTVSPHAMLTRLDDAGDGERRVVLAAEGEVCVAYAATVDLAPHDGDLTGLEPAKVRDLPPQVLPFLMPSRYCPSDQFEAFAASQFGPRGAPGRPQAALAWVAGNLVYSPGVSNSETTAIDTFMQRAGVCRDFTHLAVSLLRACDTPARAVSAHALGLEPPDMHAVVEVWLGDQWRLVDPTGKAAVDGLVRVASGRDAADIAFMTVFGRTELVSQSFSVERLCETVAA